MADRPDLRQIAVDIGAALAGYDREQLLEMLTYVFKEYVVEGAPPVLVSQVDGIEALDGLTFPQLIEQLQARLDLPELEQFAVSNGQVQVRVGGVLTPVSATEARRPGPAPAQTPVDSAGENPRATRDEALARGRGDLLGGQRGVVSAPPPRGINVSSRPGATPGQASSTPAPNPAPAEVATELKGEGDKETPGDDDASVRFSLLELD